ncbi:MAG TPA: VirB8/TrbF family protein [Terriglobales bacterium]|nr:VirB8/TrbF family protein [Terriglobales bacterium]
MKTEDPLDFAPAFDHQDRIAEEIHSLLYQENRRKTWWVGGLTAATVALTAVVVILATRKPDIRYIRIDAVGHAAAIAYNDFDYTPQDAEIRHFLWAWATYYYSRQRDDIREDYHKNYYFLSDDLAGRYEQRDLRSHLVAAIYTGQEPENTAHINDINFSSLNTFPAAKGGPVAQGQAVIDITLTYSPDSVNATHNVRQLVTVGFSVNPQEIATLAQKDPMYQILNPLGVILTYISEAPELPSATAKAQQE